MENILESQSLHLIKEHCQSQDHCFLSTPIGHTLPNGHMSILLTRHERIVIEDKINQDLVIVGGFVLCRLWNTEK